MHINLDEVKRIILIKFKAVFVYRSIKGFCIKIGFAETILANFLWNMNFEDKLF